MLLYKYVFVVILVMISVGSCCAKPVLCYILDYLFIVLPTLPVVELRKWKPKPTTTEKPTTTTAGPTKIVIPWEYSTPRTNYSFEGVDWDIHHEPNKERRDCYGHYIRCIRRTTPLIPVCGLSIATWHYEDYYSICEIEFENCMYRRENRKPMYGGPWWVNKIYHSGESYNCLDIQRRVNSPEEFDLFFFRGDKLTQLADWNRRNYEMYILRDRDSEDEYYDFDSD